MQDGTRDSLRSREQVELARPGSRFRSLPELVDNFKDGVSLSFRSLAIQDVTLVAPTIAQATGVQKP